MSAVPYLIMSIIVGVIAGALAFIILSPTLTQVGSAMLHVYRDDVRDAGFGTGQQAIVRANESCDSMNPHPELGWYCMFYDISQVILYIPAVLIAVIVSAIVLKTMVVASART